MSVFETRAVVPAVELALHLRPPDELLELLQREPHRRRRRPPRAGLRRGQRGPVPGLVREWPTGARRQRDADW